MRNLIIRGLEVGLVLAIGLCGQLLLTKHFHENPIEGWTLQKQIEANYNWYNDHHILK